MISQKTTYTRKELDQIRKNLGVTGLSDVCKILDMKTETVRAVLVNPKRYNEVVFDVVAEVLERKKQKLQQQKQRIKEAIK